MPISHDVPPNTDIPEPQDMHWPQQETPYRPIDGTAESLYTAERPRDPVDENLGHTGELAKAQGRAEIENRVNRHHAIVDARPVPHAHGTSESLNRPERPMDPADKHLGAIETQVRQVPAPAGKAFADEPKQG